MTSEKTPFLIVNESAGATPELRDRLTHVADEKGCAIETARGPGDITTLVHRASDGGPRRIIVAGGDGTINAAVNVLAQASHPVELAIVPLGTGNDLARALDIPRNDPEAALELATEGTSQPIDLVRLADGSEGFFVNACSAGFAGKVCANISPEDKARWGGFAYWLTAVSMLSELPTYRIRMEFEHHEFEGEVHCVVVANGRYVGGGFPIAPAALLDDGVVNVTIVPEQSSWEILSAGLDFMLDRDGDS